MKNSKMAILFTMLVSLSSVALVMASQISATKTTNPATPNTYHVGDTIHYVMTVSNPAGNLATNILNDIHDHEPNGTIHSFVPPDPALVQAPGDSKAYLLDYLVALADVTFTPAVPPIPGVFEGIPAHRAVIDEFHALGVDTLSDAVTATVQRNSFIVFPCIDVNKTVEPTVAIPGEEVVYTFTICNCGDVNLTLTAVDDNVLGDLISFVPAAGLVLNGGLYNAQGQLQLGECTTFTVPYTVQEGDPDPLCNLVTATGVDLIGGPAGTVTDTDPACLDLVEPNIMVVKECNEFSKVGDVIDYDVTITNTGSTNMQILSVNDTVAGPQSGCVGNVLAPAGTCSFSYKHTVVQGDPDPLINTVTVIGKAVGVDINVTDSTTCETDLVHPDVNVTKECLTDPISGIVAEFRITITNTGDVNLIITTNEPEIPGPNALPPGGTIVADVNRLVPAGAADVNNTVNVTATLPPEFGLSNVLNRSATATCTAPVGGATRTWGFWKEHTAFTECIFAACGSSFDLGWRQVTTNDQLFGIFFANNAKNADGSKRCPLGQARVTASHQALAALLNTCLANGKPLPAGVTPCTIANTLECGTIAQVNALNNILDAFNNSGDTVNITQTAGCVQGNGSTKYPTPNIVFADTKSGSDCTASKNCPTCP